MTTPNATQPAIQPPSAKYGCLTIIKILLLLVLITSLIGLWWVKHNIYASKYSPVTLSESEQKNLEQKLSLLDKDNSIKAAPSESLFKKDGLKPEAYSEKGLPHEINLTERELNSIVAANPEMSDRVAIDLSDNLVSIKMVIPVDEEIALLGGKTIRLNLGMILSYADNRPVITLKGVTIGGIPVPNAWLGNLKAKNLVEEFGDESGFWNLFAGGVKDIKVEKGKIRIVLHE
ncbi:MAG: arginine N-succinyltransferase [Nitrospira sp.]|nr:arginine N-succinyltransferase [bacterium]MBL7049492.1 arginine N-succinyltransferase [Nitrospira sp.]